MRRWTTADGLVVFSAGQAARKIVVYGDSNAQQYGPRVEALLAAHPEHPLEIVFAATGSCAPLPGLRVGGSARCIDHARRVEALIAQPDVDGVVLIAQWPGYAFNAEFTLPGPAGDEIVTPESIALATALDAFGERIRRWRAAGRRVHVVWATPAGDALDPRRLVERTLDGAYRLRTGGVPREEWDRRSGWLAARIERVAREAGATFIDPAPLLCTASVCPATTPDGEPIYRDAAHLRASFVREHVDYLDAIILDSR
jgi:hypothetical protein